MQHAAAVFGTGIEANRYVPNERPPRPAPPFHRNRPRHGPGNRRDPPRGPSGADEGGLRAPLLGRKPVPQPDQRRRRLLPQSASRPPARLRHPAPRRTPGLPAPRASRPELADRAVRPLPPHSGDLGREKGMSTSNLVRWAKTHNIPLRLRGSAGQNQALRAADEAGRAPRILRPALTGRGADERLSRFAAASAHPSLSAAAAALGLNTFTPVAQINRIERELVRPLLVRPTRKAHDAYSPGEEGAQGHSKDAGQHDALRRTMIIPGRQWAEIPRRTRLMPPARQSRAPCCRCRDSARSARPRRRSTAWRHRARLLRHQRRH